MTLAALPKPLRTQPDNTVKAARDIAEMAARAALQQRAVGEGNAVTITEMAAEKDAKSLLMPMSCRRQMFGLSDDMATKLDIEFYQDARDALLKALVD